MENEKQGDIEREAAIKKEIEKEAITKENRERYIDDYDELTGRETRGCRRAFLVMVGSGILLLLIWYFRTQ